MLQKLNFPLWSHQSRKSGLSESITGCTRNCDHFGGSCRNRRDRNVFFKIFIEIIQHNSLLQWSLSGFYDQSVLNSHPTLKHNLSSTSLVKLPKAFRIYGFALPNCSLKEVHWNINNSFFTLQSVQVRNSRAICW